MVASLVFLESLVLDCCLLECDSLEFSETLSKLELWSCKGVSECLPSILIALPLSLHTLVLTDCELESEDLNNLIQASDCGRLPNLKLLDITRNGLTNSLMENVMPGVSFSSLQELAIDGCPTLNSVWPNLKSLFLSRCAEDSLGNIIEANDRGFFPKLRTVCAEDFLSYDIALARSLSERNIYCHRMFPAFDDPFSSVRCYCQMKLNSE